MAVRNAVQARVGEGIKDRDNNQEGGKV